MALPNLSGSNVQDTFQRVVHTDGTILYDGTGSVVLDATELAELQSLGSNDVSWTALATVNQYLSTTADPTFGSLTVTNVVTSSKFVHSLTSPGPEAPMMMGPGEWFGTWIGKKTDDAAWGIRNGSGAIVASISPAGQFTGNSTTATTATNILAAINSENEDQYVSFLDTIL